MTVEPTGELKAILGPDSLVGIRLMGWAPEGEGKRVEMEEWKGHLIFANGSPPLDVELYYR